MYKQKTDGFQCSSYSVRTENPDKEYKGGQYIDLSQEYDIEDLILKFGQEWMIAEPEELK